MTIRCLMAMVTLLVQSTVAQAVSTPVPALPPTTSSSVVKDAPEVQAQMLKMKNLSEEIAKKIAEIEMKQKEIETEVYPAFRPALVGEKENLMKQLHELELKKQKAEMDQTVKYLTNELR